MGTLTDVTPTTPAVGSGKGSKVINIRTTPNHGTPFVDCEPAEVDKELNESLEWQSNQPFEIRFANNPFLDSSLSGWVAAVLDPTTSLYVLNSGQADPNSSSTVSGSFKYDVRVKGVVSDPTVVIKP